MRHQTCKLVASLGFAAIWISVMTSTSADGRTKPHSSHKNDTFDSNPQFQKEIVNLWSQEFFGKPNQPFRSRIEILTEVSSFRRFQQLPSRRFQGKYSSLDFQTHPHFHHKEHHNNRNSVNFRNIEGPKPKVETEHLEWMLKNVFTYTRNHNTSRLAKNIARKFIVDSLERTSGLFTSIQHFYPLQFLKIYDNGALPMGSNIIGIIKGIGWGTSNDRPVLVGAHWDTVNSSPGTDDNGSGVAAMLEAARAISHSGCWPKHSMIFVAFDLEEVGCQGSLVFIKEYLMKILSSNLPREINFARFQGAFILDTILNFNDTEGSQEFPPDWISVLPAQYEEVVDNQFKGDFLTLTYRRDVDNLIAKKFDHHWKKSSQDSKLKLKLFPLNLGKALPPLDVVAKYINFLRSDHVRFWYINDTETSSGPATLNAVLMTDTGSYRGNMRDCYHSICDGPEVLVHNNPNNMKFLSKITQVLTDTLVDLSECQ